jgi:ElaB/YqjD/DUF883 family membrane-anchored ribosome-binding protein
MARFRLNVVHTTYLTVNYQPLNIMSTTTHHRKTHNHEEPEAQETSLTEQARELLDATANVAGEKAAEARDRLRKAIENGRRVALTVRDKTVAGAKATDKAIQANPYKAIAIAAGVAALIGFVLGRRRSSNTD